MKILVTGATGQLGQDVVRTLKARSIDCIAASRDTFDLTDEAAVEQFVLACRPDAIIHCAAYTAIDRAENEPHRCMAVNSMGTMSLVRSALKTGAKLMYISSAQVFGNSGDMPFETGDRTAPCNVYGLSKLQGEEAVRGLMTRYFIVRTSWLFGRSGGDFVKTTLRQGREKKQIDLPDDRFAAPTFTADLAVLLADMIVTDRYGVYHATNEGCCTPAEFGQAILLASGSRCHVNPAPSPGHPSAAQRPRNGQLSKASLDEAGFTRLPIWEDALTRYLAELRRTGELK